MNTILKRAMAVAAALVMCVAAGAAAAPGVRYPELMSTVTDDANVLSQAVSADIISYADMVDDEADVEIYVAIVHFLDGESAQSYADELFRRSGFDDDSFLLLGAVGEDSFASCSGADVKQRFSDSNAQNLLYSSRFGELFKAGRYDEAFCAYFTAFNDMIEKRYGETIKLGKLFGSAQPPVQAAQSETSGVWDNVMSAINDSTRQYTERHRDSGDGEGLTPLGWVAVCFFAVLIFGGNKKNGRRGCGPLGWIFGIFGLSKLFGRRKG